jgi:cobalt-zinc-cadmium efflux system membrane fusion protein
MKAGAQELRVGIHQMTRKSIRMASLAGAAALSLTLAAKASETTAPDGDHQGGSVALSQRQIEAGHFAIEPVRGGDLRTRIIVPGTVIPSGDRVARVAVRLLGTVAELKKRLGDPVEANEVVALIESREVADAKSEYLATKLVLDLQETLFNRSKMLFDSKVLSENDYLRARTIFLDARVKHDVSRQKLFALGLTEDQIEALPQQPVASLRLQELRSPIAGRIVERRVDLGSLVGREGQESELYVVVDLSVVWVELSVPPSEVAALREGQRIMVRQGTGAPATALIIFVSPLLDKDTRSARVVASLDNAARIYRPGGFVSAEIPLDQSPADVVVPKAALQSLDGKPAVFVRTDKGFEARAVVTGRQDGSAAEIISGLAAGEEIATANTFTLKAELGKGEYAHED